MQQQWIRPVWIILGMFALLIPGLRKAIFFNLMRSKFIRSNGIKLMLSVPFIRQKLLSKWMGSR